MAMVFLEESDPRGFNAGPAFDLQWPSAQLAQRYRSHGVRLCCLTLQASSDSRIHSFPTRNHLYRNEGNGTATVVPTHT